MINFEKSKLFPIIFTCTYGEISHQIILVWHSFTTLHWTHQHKSHSPMNWWVIWFWSRDYFLLDHNKWIASKIEFSSPKCEHTLLAYWVSMTDLSISPSNILVVARMIGILSIKYCTGIFGDWFEIQDGHMTIATILKTALICTWLMFRN